MSEREPLYDTAKDSRHVNLCSSTRFPIATNSLLGDCRVTHFDGLQIFAAGESHQPFVSQVCAVQTNRPQPAQFDESFHRRVATLRSGQI